MIAACNFACCLDSQSQHIMKISVFKFVNHDVPSLDEIMAGTKLGVLASKINNGETLSREDKNYISKGEWRVLGWYFDFSPICTSFVYKQYGNWYEKFAVDKTALRAVIYGHIDKILINA